VKYSCAVLSAVASSALQYLSHYLIIGTKKKKKVTGHKMCVKIFSTTSSETFIILGRTERDMIKKFILVFV
jgi:hypothetical protein